MGENNKCVYVHKDKEGVVRYVGSGTIRRAYLNYSNSGRGEQYARFVKANGRLEVEIIDECLSKLASEELERELFDEYRDTILNCCRPSSTKNITKSMFEEYLYYDESSASCLRWKTDSAAVFDTVKIKANSEAGNLHKRSGYYVLNLQGERYRVHRIVCVLHGLEVNGFVIDHKDRNRSNNCIDNLRVVSQKQNSQNLGLTSRNTSGIQGVRYDKQGNRFVANWNENEKQKFKHFPIKNYPSHEDAFNAACDYRKLMIEIHYDRD